MLTFSTARRVAIVVGVPACTAGLIFIYPPSPVATLMLFAVPLAVAWLCMIVMAVGLIARWVWHGSTVR